jgi:hypothetical protein
MCNALEMASMSIFDSRPRRVCKRVEGGTTSTAFSYTNKEARIHFLLQGARYQRSEDLQNCLSDTETQDTQETFETKIVLSPNTSNPKFSAILDFQQFTERPGNIRLEQFITFRTVVPPDSKIFHIVENGSVQNLQKSLANSEVSLNVCDPMGRSPLSVSVAQIKLAIY